MEEEPEVVERECIQLALAQAHQICRFCWPNRPTWGIIEERPVWFVPLGKKIGKKMARG